jgi:hypothetical protein
MLAWLLDAHFISDVARLSKVLQVVANQDRGRQFQRQLNDSMHSHVSWPVWFGNDNVFPSADHVPYLHRHFEPLSFDERMAKVPYIPFARTPYYVFAGKKK